MKGRQPDSWGQGNRGERDKTDRIAARIVQGPPKTKLGPVRGSDQLTDELTQSLRVCHCLYDMAGGLIRWYGPVYPASLPSRKFLRGSKARLLRHGGQNTHNVHNSVWRVKQERSDPAERGHRGAVTLLP